MTEDEVKRNVRRHGWDDAVNTGCTYNGYAIYSCFDRDSDDVFLDTGRPVYILVKDEEIRGPKDGNEWEDIRDIVRARQ